MAFPAVRAKRTFVFVVLFVAVNAVALYRLKAHLPVGPFFMATFALCFGMFAGKLKTFVLRIRVTEQRWFPSCFGMAILALLLLELPFVLVGMAIGASAAFNRLEMSSSGGILLVALGAFHLRMLPL